MTILFITNNLPPLVDGVGDYTYNIARQFAVNGHRVYIACRFNPAINTHVEGITILPMVKAWNWSCHKPICKLIREKGIEVVSLQYVPHGFHPKGLPFPLIRLMHKIKKCNVKTFIFCHELFVLPVPFNVHRCILSSLMRYITRKIIFSCDCVATSNDFYKSLIYRYTGLTKPVAVIPIASNIPIQDYSITSLKLFRKTIARENEIILSFLGNRNLQTSLNVINKLLKKGFPVVPLFIGKTSSCYDNIPPNAVKTGVLDVCSLSKYIQVSDLLLMPEDNEFGCSFKSGVLAAGLTVGVPVVTSRGKMTPTMLKNKVNICFTDFTKEAILENDIAMLIKDRELRLQIAKNAKRIGQRNDWKSVYNEYMDIILKDNG